MKPANQQFRLPRRRANVARNKCMVELYQAGLSSTEVGQRVGTTSTHVLYVVRRAGVPVRPISEAKALAHARAVRRELIATAAQRLFGHLRAPAVPQAPAELPPVNAGFDDDVLEPGWEDAWQ